MTEDDIRRWQQEVHFKTRLVGLQRGLNYELERTNEELKRQIELLKRCVELEEERREIANEEL